MQTVKEDAVLEVTLYNPKNGMILASRYGQQASIDLEGLPCVAGTYDAGTYYIDIAQSPPVAVLRPAPQIAQDKTEIIADGSDTVTLSSLPVPCVVTAGEARYDVPDGELEWATLMPATYRIRVEAFPYLDWESEVTAVAGDVQAD
jgi:hypothetical protein